MQSISLASRFFHLQDVKILIGLFVFNLHLICCCRQSTGTHYVAFHVNEVNLMGIINASPDTIIKVQQNT